VTSWSVTQNGMNAVRFVYFVMTLIVSMNGTVEVTDLKSILDFDKLILSLSYSWSGDSDWLR